MISDFGISEAMPELPAELSRSRIARLGDWAAEGGWDRLVVTPMTLR
ncbi:MAG: hypothetical protein V3S62_00175 [Acidimicrobiia bacterium]